MANMTKRKGTVFHVSDDIPKEVKLCNVKITMDNIKDILSRYTPEELDDSEIQKNIETCFRNHLIDSNFFQRDWSFRDWYNGRVHLALGNASDCDYEWSILKLIHRVYENYDNHWYTLDISDDAYITTGDIDKILLNINDEKFDKCVNRFGIYISKSSLLNVIKGCDYNIKTNKSEIARLEEKKRLVKGIADKYTR